MTKNPTTERPAEPFRFPPLVEAAASLSPLEKSLLGHFILLSRPRLLLEIGVYRAVTTRFLIEFLEINNLPCRVVGFDLPEMVEQLRREHPDAARWEREGKLELVGGNLPFSLRDWLARNSREAKGEGREPEASGAHALPLSTLDPRPSTQVGLALVDARHDFPSVDWELKLLWPHLAPDGYILGHDYSADFDGVRYAFDHFAREVGAMLLPLQSAALDSPDFRSVLVALRRRTYEKSAGSWLRHHWHGTKANLVRGGVTGALWKAVRPLLRGGR